MCTTCIGLYIMEFMPATVDSGLKSSKCNFDNQFMYTSVDNVLHLRVFRSVFIIVSRAESKHLVLTKLRACVRQRHLGGEGALSCRHEVR